MNISVIGLGKLGLCSATCFASKGHKVIGVDVNTDTLSKLKAHKCPIDETGLEELLEKSWDNLTFTDNFENAVLNSEITLIIVPTPSNPNGRFSNQYVEKVLKSLSSALSKKHSFHVVDVVSTVMPGTSDKVFKPMLENLTHKICSKDFGLVYNPEFIALGSVIRNFLNPDMVLIGSSDEKSALLVKELYQSMCDNNPYIAMMSLINAEITKLALNCFVTMKISFVNELSSICEKLPGADVDEVTNALGADTRIGSKYLKGGLGFGGPCFPRDNLAFQAFAEEVGIEAKLSGKVVEINDEVVDRLFNKVRENVKSGKIAILGLSYKPYTYIVEESQSIILTKRLVEEGYSVAVHDPKALDEAKNVLGNSVDYYSNLYDCVKNADTLVLMTDWQIYRELDWQKISNLANENALIVDSWRVLRENIPKGMKYLGIGLGR